MAMLRERLRPVLHTNRGEMVKGESDPLWLRYADLVKLGYSAETSLIVADAPVLLETITTLLLPDARALRAQGFSAGSGWDPVTGFGSPNAANLALGALATGRSLWVASARIQVVRVFRQYVCGKRE
jgi:hypothetical protein